MIAMLGSGCHSSQPSSASFASVVIHNHSLAEVQQTTAQVFRENGYFSAVTGPNTMLFEREGSRANDIAYNGIAGSYYGEKSKVRVRGEVVELGGNSWRLQCQAFMVRNAGDSFFEEESRLTQLRAGPYQRMLNETAKRLQ